MDIWSPVDGPAWEGLRGSFDRGDVSLGVGYEVLKFNNILSVFLSHAVIRCECPDSDQM